MLSHSTFNMTQIVWVLSHLKTKTEIKTPFKWLVQRCEAFVFCSIKKSLLHRRRAGLLVKNGISMGFVCVISFFLAQSVS